MATDRQRTTSRFPVAPAVSTVTATGAGGHRLLGCADRSFGRVWLGLPRRVRHRAVHGIDTPPVSLAGAATVAMAWTHPVAKGRRLCPGEHDCDGAFGTGQDAGCPTPPNCRRRHLRSRTAHDCRD